MFISLTLLSAKERVLSLFGRVYVSLSSTAPLSETTELFLKGVLLNSNIPPIENIFSIGGFLGGELKAVLQLLPIAGGAIREMKTPSPPFPPSPPRSVKTS